MQGFQEVERDVLEAVVNLHRNGKGEGGGGRGRILYVPFPVLLRGVRVEELRRQKGCDNIVPLSLSSPLPPLFITTTARNRSDLFSFLILLYLILIYFPGTYG